MAASRFISALTRRLISPSETLQGYEHPELVNVIFQKTMEFQPRTRWPLMVGISSVLDFGGGCGVHYKQAAISSPEIRWAVVETPAMVDAASKLKTDRLQFFASVSDAVQWLGPVDLMHSDGALQYTAEPETVVRQLCGVGAYKMVWYRILLSKEQIQRNIHTSRLLDNGPGGRSLKLRDKQIQLVETRISETSFLCAHTDYSLSKRLVQAAGNRRSADGFEFDRRSFGKS